VFPSPKEPPCPDPAAGTEESGIPWFLFLDGEGKVLVHSGGPKDNTGFPSKVEEVERFAAMLDKVKVNLTAADVKTLTDSLHAVREASVKPHR
jgi:hypothetical protein